MPALTVSCNYWGVNPDGMNYFHPVWIGLCRTLCRAVQHAATTLASDTVTLVAATVTETKRAITAGSVTAKNS